MRGTLDSVEKLKPSVAFRTVTKFRGSASIQIMGTARYYPQNYSPNPVKTAGAFRGWPYLGAGVALISALTVFVSLCERDNSMLLATDSGAHHTSVQPATGQRLPAVSTDTRPAPDTITRVTVSTSSAQPAPTATSPSGALSKEPAVDKITERRYVDFTLARSRRLQEVGPIAVGVWKVDAKHKLYDVSLMANGRRVDRKRVGLNSPVSIASGEAGRPFQLVVSSIARNSISGYVTGPTAGR